MNIQFKSLLYKLIRQGFTYQKILKEIELSQYYNLEQLEVLQNEKLRKLIFHCYKKVPYYTELFNRLGLKPEHIRTKEDLQRLPLLDKKTVRENYDKLVATKIPGLMGTWAETSGSTGTPTKYLRDYYSVNFENAIIHRFRQWAQVEGLKQVTLRGEVVAPVTQKGPPFWKYDIFNREMVLSSYHLAKDNTAEYWKKLFDFQPDVLFAFPSSGTQLAQNLIDEGRIFPLKTVFTSSEMLTGRQRKCMEEAFSCKVVDWYGQVERVSAIGQCEMGTYHIMEDYSITETLETDYGLELVGTNLNNYIMPLIRFRTYDIVELNQKECSCGRNFRTVEKIHGRAVNYILSPEGNKISLFLVSDCIDYANNVNEVQFVQKQQGKLQLNIVKNEHFTQRDRVEIISKIKQHTSPRMEVVINEVDRIPRGPNGKVVDSIIRVD